jgi:hypothetical protein
LAYLQDEL